MKRSLYTSLRIHPSVIGFARILLARLPLIDEQLRLIIYYTEKYRRTLTSREVAINFAEPEGKRFLMVDVSHLIRRDMHTGIQRVLRSLLLEWLQTPPVGYHVTPVYVDDRNRLREGRAFAAFIFNQPTPAEEDPVITVHPNDVWFTADTFMKYPPGMLRKLRRYGVHISFVIYDILPLMFPRFFYKAHRLEFLDWFRLVMEEADEVVCISRTVADDVHQWLEANTPTRSKPLSIGHFHLGADITASKPTYGIKPHENSALSAMQKYPVLLMVGTLEPRKGHAQVIEAMNRLWSAGENINLVIVGKEGWRARKLAETLRAHPEHGRHLFWFNDASDELLQRLYAESTALVAASYGEGFGLPLIESAAHGLPVIARDIPVFREVAGEHAYYFHNTYAEPLAEEIRAWLALNEKNEAPTSIGMPYLTWAESSRQLRDVLAEKRWDYVWKP